MGVPLFLGTANAQACSLASAHEASAHVQIQGTLLFILVLHIDLQQCTPHSRCTVLVTCYVPILIKKVSLAGGAETLAPLNQ